MRKLFFPEIMSEISELIAFGISMPKEFYYRKSYIKRRK